MCGSQQNHSLVPNSCDSHSLATRMTRCRGIALLLMWLSPTTQSRSVAHPVNSDKCAAGLPEPGADLGMYLCDTPNLQRVWQWPIKGGPMVLAAATPDYLAIRVTSTTAPHGTPVPLVFGTFDRELSLDFQFQDPAIVVTSSGPFKGYMVGLGNQSTTSVMIYPPTTPACTTKFNVSLGPPSPPPGTGLVVQLATDEGGECENLHSPCLAVC